MIKGIIFDLDDTLYDYASADKTALDQLCHYTCSILHITQEEFYEAYQYGKRVTKENLPDCAAQHNRLLYCQKACEYLGVNPLFHAIDMYEMYWGTFLQQIQIRQGVLDFFKILKIKDIKTAICTDLTAHIQYRKIQKLGIAEYVDCLITSEEIGKEKPEQRMFRACLNKMKLSPAETVFIGDSLKKDIKGAIAVGMQAIWFCKNDCQITNDPVLLRIRKFTDKRLLTLCD